MSVSSKGSVTVIHPDLRVEYQRGIYLYAKSLMSGLHSSHDVFNLLTDAIPTGNADLDVARLIDQIEAPEKLRIRAWQMLPRYLRMEFLRRVRVDLWRVPLSAECGDRSRFLRSANGILNVEMIYEVCRLAGNKPFVRPLNVDFLSEVGTDLVMTTAPAAVRSGMSKVKIIQTVHDLILYDASPLSSSHRKFRRRVMACVQHADMIVSMSEFTKNELLRYHPEADGRVRVLYQPIPADDDAISQSALPRVQADVLQRFGLKKKQFLLFIGAVEARKNVANLIHAHRLSRLASQIPLVIVGGVDASYLTSEGLAPKTNERGFGLIQGVEQQDAGAIFVGRVTELEKLALLRSAALFVFPTLLEGFGIPVLEAQSMGCPVLASTSSTMPEVLGQSARLVEHVTDINELSGAIDDVIGAPLLMEDLASAGLINSSRFSKGAFASKLSNLVAECRELPPRRSH